MRVGVIGCGKIGSALIRGMIRRRFVSSGRVLTWHPDPRRLRRVARSLRIRAARSNGQVASGQVILLAVKPGQMRAVLDEIRGDLSHRPLLISVAAGFPTRWIEGRVGKGIAVVRAMPNTPALVGAGISAIAPGRWARPRQLRLAQRLLACVGEVVRVPERWMDAVTAVSGSGPAYFFFLMERMIAAGVRLGLSAQVARHLVLQTALGAARLAIDSGQAPERLRAQVTSKGGTTEAAFRALAKERVGLGIERAIQAAFKRAEEL